MDVGPEEEDESASSSDLHLPVLFGFGLATPSEADGARGLSRRN